MFKLHSPLQTALPSFELICKFYFPALYEKVEITPSEADKTKPNNLIVVMSSDRGLCGGIHSNLVKAVKATLAEKGADNVKIVSCGDKARQLFLRTHGKKRKPPMTLSSLLFLFTKG